MSTTYQDTRSDERTDVAETSNQSSTGINVGEAERIASLVGGGMLALLGLRRGTLGGLGAVALGGVIAYRGIKGHCAFYEKLGMNTAKPAKPNDYFEHGIHVEVATTIDRSASEIYTFWRNFENLPKFMDHLESVKVLDVKRSQWTARGPAGTSVTWDAEIINDVPDQAIAWRSLAGAQVDNAGSVRFREAPGGRGTEVHVVLDYIPPGRILGKWVAKLFGEDPQTQIETDLRRFKMLMETGEVSKIDGQPRGNRATRPSTLGP